MYTKQAKLIAETFYLEHIPNEFKFGQFDEFDVMELYEELFDYSYEIINDLPLASNFNIFANNKNEVKKFLLSKLKDEQIGSICKVCYDFCGVLTELLN